MPVTVLPLAPVTPLAVRAADASDTANAADAASPPLAPPVLAYAARPDGTVSRRRRVLAILLLLAAAPAALSAFVVFTEGVSPIYAVRSCVGDWWQSHFDSFQWLAFLA